MPTSQSANFVFIGLSCFLAMFFLSSCVSVPSYEGPETVVETYPYSRGTQPQLWVTYYPAYSPLTYPHRNFSGKKPVWLADVQPYRNHAGSWSDDVMRYDLDSMQTANIQAVLLMVQPQELLDQAKLNRIRRFFSLASARRPRICIGLGIYSRTKLSMGSGNFSRFLIQSDLHDLPAKLTISKGQGLLVAFDDRVIDLHRQNFPEESSVDIRTFKQLRQHGIAWILGGDSGDSQGIAWDNQYHWRQPRGDGSFFREMLTRAFKEKKTIVCIHSWNRLNDGSFLIRNNFDDEILLNTLRTTWQSLQDLQMKDD